jgi:hypothetical protein
MANKDFDSLFKVYPNRNPELRAVAKQAYEFGATVAKEADAAMSSGLLDHSIKRQRSYIAHMQGMIDALAAKPTPDLAGTHPTWFNIDLTEKYETFVTDVNGAMVPINEMTQLLATYWMLVAVELAVSQSAAIAGSLVPFDHERAKNNIAVIEKLLTEMTARPVLDLPETSVPGTGTESASESKN